MAYSAPLKSANRRRRQSAVSASAKTRNPRAAGRKLAATVKPRTRRLIDDVTAILLISPNAKKLCEFYKAVLGLPMKEEMHDGMPLHYGYSLGDVHFAIHNATGWPGGPAHNAQSPIISFGTSNMKAILERLSAKGIKVTGPTDHGFANVASFRDPDGNFISLVEYGREYW